MSLEDFTTYADTDEDGDFTILANDITVATMRRDAVSYIIKDKGAAHFGDFEHLTQIEITATSTTRALLGVWAVSNTNFTHQDMADNLDGMCVRMFYRNSPSQLELVLQDYDDGDSDLYIAAEDTIYYLRISRSGTDLVCVIYDDPGRTVGDIVDTLTATCDTTTYQYINTCYSADLATYPDVTIDGDIHDLDLQEAGAHTPSDTAGASDSIKFDVEEHMSDDANANDEVSFQPEVPLEDTAHASDSISFQFFRVHNIEDTAHASDELKFDAEINLEDIAKAKDTIIVPVMPPESYPGGTFTLHGTSTAILFPKPEWNSPDNGITKNIGLLNFRSGRLNTVDKGIETQTLTFGGVVVLHEDTATWEDLTAMTTWLNDIKTAMNNGEKFTINELGNCLNGVYVINDFRFDTIVGVVDAWSWSLVLERAKDV